MAFYKVCGNYYGTDNNSDSLMHYRTPGSKNGVRKYQYEDGTLTPAGKIHYGIGLGPKGGAVNTFEARNNIRAPQQHKSSYPLALGSSNVRNRFDRESQSILNKDARPTGINKTLYDVFTWARQASADVNKAVDDAKNWVGDRASDVKKWGDQAGKDIGKTASNTVGTVKKAGDWVGDRLEAKNVEKAVSDAKEWIGNRASDVDKWVDKNITGDSAKSDREWYRFRAMVSDNDRVRGDYRGYNSPGNDKEKFDKKNAQREEESGKVWREKASDAQRAYDKSLAGKAENAVKDVGKAAKNAGDWVGERAKDVGKAAKNAGDWVGERAKDVGNAVGTAAKNVGSWAGTAAKDVAKLGEGAVNKGRDFITGLFGKKKK